MGNEKNNLDDLIGTSGGAPIIVQESGGDKKLIYILLIVLLILFLLAIGVIAYLGNKYFSQNSNPNKTIKSAVVAPVQKSTTEKQKQIVAQKSENSTAVAPEATKQEVSELEQMVAKEEAKKVKKEEHVTVENVQKPQVAKAQKKEPVAVPAVKPATQEEKAIQTAAQATTGKALSQEDLAKIAALVAKELAKAKTVQPASKSATTSNKSVESSKQDDAALVAQLEQAQTDTLANTQEQTTNLKGDVKAGTKKKVDTFNKVIVSEKSANDDELSKLAQEIDTILKSEDVKKGSKEVKYVKDLSKEAAQREKELRFIVVKKGDTLSSIAYRAYGRASAYTKIYEANPDIVRNPNRIYVGMRLRVPVDEEYKKQQGK